MHDDPDAERGDGWQLAPVLSLDALRLMHSLGGRVEYDLRSAVVPFSAAGDVVERVNPRTLHAGPNEQLDCAAGLAQALSRELGAWLARLHAFTPAELGLPTEGTAREATLREISAWQGRYETARPGPVPLLGARGKRWSK